MSAIRRAVQAAGGVSNLARAIGVTAPSVHQWITEVRPVPPGRCISIEQATSGDVTRYELRPDIFGEPKASAPKPRKAA
jgi:DNA-binding transcriptional regulator YdaS (Cro superfamily)